MLQGTVDGINIRDAKMVETDHASVGVETEIRTHKDATPAEDRSGEDRRGHHRKWR